MAEQELEFSDKKVVGQVVVKVDITEEDIENIITSSFEGGSNYWMGVNNVGENWENKPKGTPISEWATKLIIDGKEVGIVDFEEDENYENPYPLTLEKLIKGIEQNNRERTWATDKDNWDGIDCDCIIQYALFNEVVYG